MIVDFEAGTRTLTIDGAPMVIPGGMPVESAFVSLFISFGGTGADEVVFDDIEVVGSQCPTAVEAESWAEIKRRYSPDEPR